MLFRSRVSSLDPVKVVEVKSKQAEGINSTELNTAYGKPTYQKNEKAQLVDLTIPKHYTIDFMTEKGKTYTIGPL